MGAMLCTIIALQHHIAELVIHPELSQLLHEAGPMPRRVWVFELDSSHGTHQMWNSRYPVAVLGPFVMTISLVQAYKQVILKCIHLQPTSANIQRYQYAIFIFQVSTSFYFSLCDLSWLAMNWAKEALRLVRCWSHWIGSTERETMVFLPWHRRASCKCPLQLHYLKDHATLTRSGQ